MLPLKNRLKKEKDFKLVFKRGKSFREDDLLLRLVENNLKTVRFGFVVGLKVSKKANLRNKLKRRLREIIRKKLPVLKTGFDVILITDKGLINKSFQEMEALTNSLLKKAKICGN